MTEVKLPDEILVDVYSAAPEHDIFKLSWRDRGVINVLSEYKRLNLIIDDKLTKSEFPPIKIIKFDHKGNPFNIIAEPLEPAEYRFGGRFIFSFDPRFLDISRLPVPLHDRKTNYDIFKSKE